MNQSSTSTLSVRGKKVFITIEQDLERPKVRIIRWHGKRTDEDVSYMLDRDIAIENLKQIEAAEKVEPCFAALDNSGLTPFGSIGEAVRKLLEIE